MLILSFCCCIFYFIFHLYFMRLLIHAAGPTFAVCMSTTKSISWALRTLTASRASPTLLLSGMYMTLHAHRHITRHYLPAYSSCRVLLCVVLYGFCWFFCWFLLFFSFYSNYVFDYSFMCSCELDLGLQHLLVKIWEYLNLVRVYTKVMKHTLTLARPLSINTDLRCYCH